MTAPTSRSKRTAFTAHSWGSWWAGASHSWKVLMMVFVLQCVSTCSLTRRWTSPCLHARIRALCSAKYRAETFPKDQETKKGKRVSSLFTQKEQSFASPTNLGLYSVSLKSPSAFGPLTLTWNKLDSEVSEEKNFSNWGIQTKFRFTILYFRLLDQNEHWDQDDSRENFLRIWTDIFQKKAVTFLIFLKIIQFPFL